jgi:hypothetical protein
MPRILTPLPSLQLDPRNTSALLNEIQTRIYLESGGTLNDFSASSPLAAITEGQAFATSELLYYLNGLPEAFAIQWMKLLGIQRIVGSTAHVEVFFSKIPTYRRPVSIPSGTELYTSRGLKFILVEEVIIDSNSLIKSGMAVSEKWGSIYNIPPRSLTTINKAIIGLESVYNVSPGKGGEDTESVAEMKSRAFSLLRRRSLVTQEDYINEIFNILPQLDIVELTNLEENIANQLLFVIGYNSADMVETQVKQSILDSLRQKSPLGVTISITEPTYTPIKVSLTAEYDSRITSSDTVAYSIRDLLVEEYKPTTYGLGASLTTSGGLNRILFSSSISNVTRYELYLLIPQGDNPDLFTDACDPLFDSYRDLDTNICIRKNKELLSDAEDTTDVYFAEPLETFKIYELEVVTIDTAGNALIYNFDELYEITI